MFDYVLPPNLIAQQPAPERDSSRLMEIDRAKGDIHHHFFRDLPALLNPGDLLVLNNTRVLPARLIGRREKTGGKWEGLFLRETPHGLWEMLAQTKGKPQDGEHFIIERGSLKLILRGRVHGHWVMEPESREPTNVLLEKHGNVPLPPYIRKGYASDDDRERYQTIFAQADGSVAAPTAGLHFTPCVFESLRSRGIDWKCVTLHVGLGTFEPIRCENPSQHTMHVEWADVPQETVDAIEKCKARRNRVIGVGTTAVRALESASLDGNLRAWQGETDLFIQSPHSFMVIDGLITNFHLPRTTLLLLVGAFAGTELLRRAYETAIAMSYRFYSYGDAMFIK